MTFETMTLASSMYGKLPLRHLNPVKLTFLVINGLALIIINAWSVISLLWISVIFVPLYSTYQDISQFINTGFGFVSITPHQYQIEPRINHWKISASDGIGTYNVGLLNARHSTVTTFYIFHRIKITFRERNSYTNPLKLIFPLGKVEKYPLDLILNPSPIFDNRSLGLRYF